MPNVNQELKQLRNEARYWRGDTESKLQQPNAKRRFKEFCHDVVTVSSPEIMVRECHINWDWPDEADLRSGW